MLYEVLDANGVYRFDSPAAPLVALLAAHPGWSARVSHADLVALAAATTQRCTVALEVFSAADAASALAPFRTN